MSAAARFALMLRQTSSAPFLLTGYGGTLAQSRVAGATNAIGSNHDA